jgi:hypothetical protein
MKDMRKLDQEISELQQRFGQDNIIWDKGYEWVLIETFQLPPGINRIKQHFFCKFDGSFRVYYFRW